jgi:hypothetical protein
LIINYFLLFYLVSVRIKLEKERINRDEFGKRLEKEREENPIIQEALRLFDGKIVGSKRRTT